MHLLGRFRLGWEYALPSFHSFDIIDIDNLDKAVARKYELSWFGKTLTWSRKVDRAFKEATLFEPWERVVDFIEIFRRGF